MPENQWFYQVLGETVGPLSDDEFRDLVVEHRIQPDTFVRLGERGDWETADRLGLFDNGRQISANDQSNDFAEADAIAAAALGLDVTDVSSQCGKDTSSSTVPGKTIPCPDCGRTVSKRATACPHCGAPFASSVARPITRSTHTFANASSESNPESGGTEIFAVLTFACGAMSLLILPILFAPLAIIFSIVSYYRLKDAPRQKGRGLRIVGHILASFGILWLMYTLFWR